MGKKRCVAMAGKKKKAGKVKKVVNKGKNVCEFC